MRILLTGSIHFYMPWFNRIDQLAHEHDAVALSGNSMALVGGGADIRTEIGFLRCWLHNLHVPVFYSMGGYDPREMPEWPKTVPNLRLFGRHELAGWNIEVLDLFGQRAQPINYPGQTIVVSNRPPAETKCGTGRDGSEHGSRQIREEVEELENTRVILCGGCIDPISRVDTLRGAVVINPGMSPFEHDGPAYASIDTERRSFFLNDGRRSTVHSFAR